MLKEEILAFLGDKGRSVPVIKREMAKMGYSDGDVVTVMEQLIVEGRIRRARGRGIVYKVVKGEEEEKV